MKTLSLLLGFSLAVTLTTQAKKTQSARTGAQSPEEELAGFELQDGFIAELVASERDGVINPIDISFDDAGRLWTQTARMYPMDPVKDIKWNKLLRLMDNPEAQDKNPEFKRIKDLYQGKTKGTDEIIVLSGIYPNQKISTHKFATGLAIPQSILPYRNGVFVAQGSEFFYLEDSNNDGTADKRVPILSGFGFTDTHTMAHCMVRGPGGWIHFTQGALNKGKITATRSGESIRMDYSKNAKFSLDGNKLELINSGNNNIWGYTLQSKGQWYGIEANDQGKSVFPMEEQTGFNGIGSERLRPYQPFYSKVHKFRVGGTGLSGLAFSEDGSAGFPEEWKDVAILANPINSEINTVRIKRQPDGSIVAEHLKPLLKSKDDWFRPVHIEFGPDGCLYVVDWYNKIVSHNELPTTHPDRDKSHGRIWRIRHKSQKTKAIPNLKKAATTDLVKHLSAPVLWEKRAAWHQISDRPSEETKNLVPSLVKLAADNSADEATRIHALWSLESLGQYDATLMPALIASGQPELKREAIRTLVNFKLDATTVAKLLDGLINDPDAMIRSQVLRTLSDINQANNATIKILVDACKKELPGNAMGGAYERKFERFLARQALEKYPSELQQFLATPQGTSMPATNLLWANQALPGGGNKAFLEIWKNIKSKPMNDSTFVVIAGFSSQKNIAKELKPMFSDKANAEKFVDLALNNQRAVQSDSFGAIIALSINNLLANSDTKLQAKGLKAISKLRVKSALPNAEKLYKNSTDEAVKLAAVKSLDVDRNKYVSTFEAILKNPNSPFSLFTQASFSMGRADGASRNKNRDLLAVFLKKNPGRKLEIIKFQANSDHGLFQLRELVDAGALAVEDFDYSTADRMNFALEFQKNATVKSIYDTATAKHKESQSKAKERIPSLIKLAEKKGGNAVTGKAIFTGMCLSCHQVGENGAGIGPALDGSAKREPEALLTALFLPDVAAEGAYVLFRVLEKDGTIHEGLKIKSDTLGATVAFQGGETIFIPRKDIRREEHAGSRSFMPSGLFDLLPDSIIADIMAHVRTVK